MKKFKWNDELVLLFAKLSTQGSMGIFDGAKTLQSKLDIFKKITTEKENDKIIKPYSFKNNKYIQTKTKGKNSIMLNQSKVKEINNLLFAVEEIKKEINRIINNK